VYYKIMLVLMVGLLAVSSPSWAQQDTTGTAVPEAQEPQVQQEPQGAPEKKEPPRFEIIPLGGYVWTISQSTTYNARGGDADFESGGFFGIAVDINLMPGIQPRLLYRRQDTKLTFKSAGTTDDLGDIAVEYWHVGVVKAIMKKDNVLPFTSITLGGTRFAHDSGDEWKFSVILGVGAKVYINEKIGLMVAGEMPWTFTNAFLGIGTGGLSIGGSGIIQFDIAAGLIISL